MREQGPARVTARATIRVRSFEASPYDQTASPVLAEFHLAETFAGDIEAESTVRGAQALFDDKSAYLVGMQRVRGSLGGRAGTFVLHAFGTVANGRIEARWSVVPGSGTGDLAGLRGDGGFEGEFGKGSEGTLDYRFE